MYRKVYLLHDSRMSLHRPMQPMPTPGETVDFQHDFENPDRTLRIYCKLLSLENRLCRSRPWNQRFIKLICNPADRDTIQLVHSAEHYENMYRTQFLSDEELMEMKVDGDLYYSRFTFLAATMAVGGVIQCTDMVTSSFSESTRAIALVRPPGHHAEKDAAGGFCFFNNVAIAAKYALYTNKARRVFILDWDIHHGNGTQDLTYDDPNIFYFSIHRGPGKTEQEWFYPGTGFADEVGEGDGRGTNVNVVWRRGGMTNVEYAAAFVEIVLPLIESYKPDLILVACGLDAAKGDLLGDCGLSPDMYFTMTESLLETAGANIPIVFALEGGYNLDVSALCMEQIALALLDEPCDYRIKKDKNGVIDDMVWTNRSIVPLMIPPKYYPDYGLGRYWNQSLWDDISQFVKKTTRAAITSMKKSLRALHHVGIDIHDAHTFDWISDLGARYAEAFLATCRNRVHPLLLCDNEEECRRPIKKRKVPIALQSALLGIQEAH